MGMEHGHGSEHVDMGMGTCARARHVVHMHAPTRSRISMRWRPVCLVVLLPGLAHARLDHVVRVLAEMVKTKAEAS